MRRRINRPLLIATFALGLVAGTGLVVSAFACGGTKVVRKNTGATANASVVIPVEGMSCGACAAKIADALRGIDGVVTASVDTEAAKATVSYIAEKATVEAMVAAIESAGFKPGEPEEPEKDKAARRSS